MNVIKKIRLELGLSQIDLAGKSGLSLRTIQRVETDSYQPKGHTLRVLADVFGVESNELQNRFLSADQVKQNDILSIKFINLSALAFFVIPFGNLIFPLMLWRKKRTSITVDNSGRDIINFQMTWSFTLMILLSVSPFISRSLFPSFPLILFVLFVAIVINLIVVFMTAHHLYRDGTCWVTSPIRFL